MCATAEQKKNQTTLIEMILFTGENLRIMRRMNSGLMDLIATDPPFNSGGKYRAPIGDAGELEEVFKDYWREQDLDQLEHALLAQYNEEEDLSLFSKTRYQGFNPLYSVITSSRATHGKGMFTYLIMMSMRLIECRRLLKETGSIYLHCDPTASHYLKKRKKYWTIWTFFLTFLI